MGWLVAAVYSKEDAVWAWSLGFPILAICGLIAWQSAKWHIDKPARLETGCGRSSEKAETTADIVRAQLGPPMEIEENGASITPRPAFTARCQVRQRRHPPGSSGEIEVHASVTIRYRIANFTPRP
jgi:hypothetical protein